MHLKKGKLYVFTRFNEHKSYDDEENIYGVYIGGGLSSLSETSFYPIVSPEASPHIPLGLLLKFLISDDVQNILYGSICTIEEL